MPHRGRLRVRQGGEVGGGGDRNALTDYKRQDWTSPDKTGFPVLRMWLKLLTVYTRREFTLYSDRLVAISGIAKKFVRLGLRRYLAGLWEEFLPQQLAWPILPLERAMFSRRVVNGGGPTWSWGSINQSCGFGQAMPRDSITSDFKVLDTRLVLKTEDDPTGPVDMARLTISAPMVKGTLVTKPNRLDTNEDYHTPFVGQAHADLLEVLVNIWGKEYEMTPDVCQWGNPKMRQRDAARGDFVGRRCRELRRAVLYGRADPDNFKNRTNDSRFPWLVLRWSP